MRGCWEVTKIGDDVTVIEKPTPLRIQEPEQPDTDRTRGRLIVLGVSAVLIAVMASLLVIGLVGLNDDDGTGSVGPAVTTIEVTLSEFKIDGNLVAQAGDVNLSVTNAGSQPHNLVVGETGVQTPILNSGDTAVLALESLNVGNYAVFSDAPGHLESGMEATLIVSADAPTGQIAAVPTHIHQNADVSYDADALDARLNESMLRFPARTAGTGNQILEPEILADGTKRFVLEASVIEWEVLPGRVVDAWAYNGMVPGPQIIVDVGDKVQVELTNHTPLGTDIRWLGIETPYDDQEAYDTIEVGETYTYEFVAEHAAIGVYHAGPPMVLNGLFGAFRVGERPYPRGETISGVTISEDFEPDVELPMVLNDAGTIDLTLNGKSFPATEPIVLKVGDWVAVDYYNEGLTDHQMQQDQFPQLVYAKDGIALDHPYWAGTVDLAPGESYSVIFQATDPGVWIWRCHILNHVQDESGIVGMVTALHRLE